MLGGSRLRSERWDYDPLRAFQAGEVQASAGEQGRGEEQIELPAVLDTGAAKALAQGLLGRRWARRDKLTLHLPPGHLGITPGTRIATGLQPREWIVERCTLDRFVMVAELRPAWEGPANVAADAGRAALAMSADVRMMTLALFDAPDVFEEASSQPTLILAASSPDASWKTSLVEVDVGSGVPQVVRTPARKSVLGRAINTLGPAYGEWDLESSLEVELVDQQHWLASCDEEAVERGSNLAIIGGEVFQFADVEPLGGGRFRLSRLLRGRLGSELATATHEPDESFLLLEQQAVRTLRLPRWTRGRLVNARALASPGAIASAVVPASGWGRTIPIPTGGATVDSEARDAIAEVLRALERNGLIES